MTISQDVFERLKPLSLSEIEPMIRDGDVLLCAAHDAGSKLIAWSTRSPWSHVALAYAWETVGRVMAFESVHTLGVRAVPIQTFITRTSSGVTPYPGKIVLARHCEFDERAAADPNAKRRFADFAVDRFGDPFATKEILKIAARVVLGRRLKPMPPMLAPDDEFICSEYVAKCFEQMGILIPWDGAGYMAPGDIAADPKVEAIAQFAIDPRPALKPGQEHGLKPRDDSRRS
jgi:hypothetical protein